MIEQHESHYKPEVNVGAPEGGAVPAQHVVSVSQAIYFYKTKCSS